MIFERLTGKHKSGKRTAPPATTGCSQPVVEPNYKDISDKVTIQRCDLPTNASNLLKVERSQPKGSLYQYLLTIDSDNWYDPAPKQGIVASSMASDQNLVIRFSAAALAVRVMSPRPR